MAERNITQTLDLVYYQEKKGQFKENLALKKGKKKIFISENIKS